VIGGLAADAMLTYQVPAMIAAGLPATTAATITGFRGIAQLADRLPLARVLRHLGARRTIAAASILAAAASVTLLASRQISAAVAYSLLGGVSLGAISALQGIYTQELVPPRDLGLLFGVQQAAFGAGGALGPAAAAVLLAITGSYAPVSAAVAAAFLPAPSCSSGSPRWRTVAPRDPWPPQPSPQGHKNPRSRR
jgi:MFS-type transporter involved in bile tolerance (Atg22 family)